MRPSRERTTHSNKLRLGYSTDNYLRSNSGEISVVAFGDWAHLPILTRHLSLPPCAVAHARWERTGAIFCRRLRLGRIQTEIPMHTSISCKIYDPIVYFAHVDSTHCRAPAPAVRTHP